MSVMLTSHMSCMLTLLGTVSLTLHDGRADIRHVTVADVML